MTQTCDHCGAEATDVNRSGFACQYHSRTIIGPAPDTVADMDDIELWNNRDTGIRDGSENYVSEHF